MLSVLAFSPSQLRRADDGHQGKAEAAWFRHQSYQSGFEWAFPKDQRMRTKAAPTRLARRRLVPVIDGHAESKLHTGCQVVDGKGRLRQHDLVRGLEGSGISSHHGVGVTWPGF